MRNMICCVFMGVLVQAQDSSVAELVQKLADDDPAIRENATTRLIQMYPQAAQKLEDVLKATKDPEVRSRLERVVREGAIGAEVQLLSKRLEKVPELIGKATSKKREDLVRFLTDYAGIVVDERSPVANPKKKTSFVTYPVLSDLIALSVLTHPDIDLEAKARFACAVGAYRVSNPRVVDMMGRWLSELDVEKVLNATPFDPEWYCVRQLFSALGRVKATKYGSVVAGYLRKEMWICDPIVSLGEMRAKEYASKIKPYLAEKVPRETKIVAVEALGAMQACECAKDVVGVMKAAFERAISEDDQYEFLVNAALRALVQMEAKSCAREVATLLKRFLKFEEKSKTRCSFEFAFVRAIIDLKDSEAGEDVVSLLRDDDPFARHCAAMILGGLNARAHIKDILPLLRDKDLGVREAAGVALSRLEAWEHLDAIEELLKDEAEWVRVNTAVALAEARQERSFKKIVELAGSEKRDTCAFQLTRALNRFKAPKLCLRLRSIEAIWCGDPEANLRDLHVIVSREALEELSALKDVDCGRGTLEFYLELLSKNRNDRLGYILHDEKEEIELVTMTQARAYWRRLAK